MDSENTPLDMNAVYAKERSVGFSLSGFISDRLDDVAVINSINDELLGALRTKYSVEENRGKYRSDVEQALKSKVSVFDQADLGVWANQIQRAKNIGTGIGRMCESALFAASTSNSEPPHGAIGNCMALLGTYMAVFGFSREHEIHIIPIVTSEIAGNISARLYKQKNLKSRKKDLEDFLRSEGIVNE